MKNPALFSIEDRPPTGNGYRMYFTKCITNARGVLRYMARGDFRGLYDRIQDFRETTLFTRQIQAIQSHRKVAWGIMAPPGTEKLAECIAARLQMHGWSTQITAGLPQRSAYDYCIVIRPQMFSRLPPKATRIIYQVENTERLQHMPPKYFRAIKSSLAVLEHAQSNIESLYRNEAHYPRTYYVPMSHSVAMAAHAHPEGATDDAQFNFMFDRFLVAMGFLPTSYVKNMSPSLPTLCNQIALSLPETPARRNIFERLKPDGCFIFDGIRRRPAWVGCGLSYQRMAQHALSACMTTLTIMEDDVILPVDFNEKLPIIHRYLEQRQGEWDIFAGVIADIAPECVVLNVDTFDGLTFVTIDRMTSTVFNIYNKKVLHALTAWNPENHDPSLSNTIDRAFGSIPGLRVVTLLPFFVGHREEADSTLWGVSNAHYATMIQASEARLLSKVQAFMDMPKTT